MAGDKSKIWKICTNCQSLGKVLKGSKLKKCKPCKGSGTIEVKVP